HRGQRQYPRRQQKKQQQGPQAQQQQQQHLHNHIQQQLQQHLQQQQQQQHYHHAKIVLPFGGRTFTFSIQSKNPMVIQVGSPVSVVFDHNGGAGVPTIVVGQAAPGGVAGLGGTRGLGGQAVLVIKAEPVDPQQ
ncbi:unnamed protein product, partial [Rotaria sordida]